MNSERFKDMLLEERRRVVDALSYLQDENRGDITHETDEEPFDQHLGDVATETLDREIDTSLGENAENVLRAIDDALARIDEGTYGTCARCGQPIAEERLEARPYATYCIECQRLAERG